MAKEIKRTVEEVYIDDIATELISLEDNILRKMRRIKMFNERERRPTEEIDKVMQAYVSIDCKSPYAGLDDVKTMLKKLASMANDPMVSKEIISISDDIETLKTIIRRINELCG